VDRVRTAVKGPSPGAVSQDGRAAYNAPALVQGTAPVSEQRRLRIGIAGIGAGLALLTIGVLWAHFTGLPSTDEVGRDLYSWVPRCLPFEGQSCWVLETTGQIVGLIGSQILMAAIVYGWVLGRPLTWGTASVAAFLFTVEMIVLFGVIPNQWLTIAQGDLEWTGQKIWFTLPKWLVLNNEVSISYGVLKDLISGGYSALMLVAIAVGAYRIQERSKRAASAAPPPPELSSYGRPLIKGSR
jgi:hypothetical protein